MCGIPDTPLPLPFRWTIAVFVAEGSKGVGDNSVVTSPSWIDQRALERSFPYMEYMENMAVSDEPREEVGREGGDAEETRDGLELDVRF
jgi:hypothetical protein